MPGIAIVPLTFWASVQPAGSVTVTTRPTVAAAVFEQPAKLPPNVTVGAEGSVKPAGKVIFTKSLTARALIAAFTGVTPTVHVASAPAAVRFVADVAVTGVVATVVVKVPLRDPGSRLDTTLPVPLALLTMPGIAIVPATPWASVQPAASVTVTT